LFYTDYREFSYRPRDPRKKYMAINPPSPPKAGIIFMMELPPEPTEAIVDAELLMDDMVDEALDFITPLMEDNELFFGGTIGVAAGLDETPGEEEGLEMEDWPVAGFAGGGGGAPDGFFAAVVGVFAGMLYYKQ
jgi:hypothetical protein